jgi:3-phosphoshikimate 1-carboxyvinyltransferase
MLERRKSDWTQLILFLQRLELGPRNCLQCDNHRSGASDQNAAADTAGTPRQTGSVILTINGPSALRGTLQVPGDKSISHRAIMLSALADGTSTIRGLSDGADVGHTLAAMQSLGADITRSSDGSVLITGGALRESDRVIDVGNSGTGIRLLAGLVAGLAFRTELDGDASIRSRPMDRIAEPLRLMGAAVGGGSDGRFAPLVITGGHLHGIDYPTPVASAQVKSAILLAGLSADGTTTVREPARTRQHTEEMLLARGADLTVDGTTTHLRRSALKPLDESVPGDPSQAAFWIAAAAAIPGSDVTVLDLYLGPARAGFLEVLQRMGADLEITTEPGSSATVRVRGGTLRSTEIEPDEVPSLVDEIPALAVAAALAVGVTRVRGAGELRVKESDRLATIAELLTAFGAPVTELEDGLDITGGAALHAARVDSHGDHRIAMAGAMAAIATTGTSMIDGFDSVATSYPAFAEHLAQCAPDARITP